MSVPIGEFNAFLDTMHAGDLRHPGQSYRTHCNGVAGLLFSWGYPRDVAAAGFFHSIYGTERFRGVLGLGERDPVRAIAGVRGEFLAMMNCVMKRDSFDQALNGEPPIVLRNRYDGGEISLTEADFLDLCAIHLADWIQQMVHAEDPFYRREEYDRLARKLGGEPLRAFVDACAVLDIRSRGYNPSEEGMAPSTLVDGDRGLPNTTGNEVSSK